ncbi:uncharacterized protein V1518DRAFT_409501 [Limtongia smithiae]|uniref:uncharacterized protein n=1 Tax=Limtongia smithiae TaxID=1125753 RepID=UPI0034CDE12D
MLFLYFSRLLAPRARRPVTPLWLVLPAFDLFASVGVHKLPISKQLDGDDARRARALLKMMACRGDIRPSSYRSKRGQHKIKQVESEGKNEEHGVFGGGYIYDIHNGGVARVDSGAFQRPWARRDQEALLSNFLLSGGYDILYPKLTRDCKLAMSCVQKGSDYDGGNPRRGSHKTQRLQSTPAVIHTPVRCPSSGQTPIASLRSRAGAQFLGQAREPRCGGCGGGYTSSRACPGYGARGNNWLL